MNTTEIKNEFYDLCYRAHANLSFSPDKRAASYSQDILESLEKFKEIGATEQQQEKLINLFRDWMHAKGRCMSSMITGPANFPVERNRRAQESESNKCKAYSDYYNFIIQKKETETYYKKNPEAKPIKSSDEDAKTRLKEKIQKLESNHELMKNINRLIRKDDRAAIKELTKWDDHAIEKLFQGDSLGRKGYAQYELTNNLANIKRLKGRLKQLESIESNGDKEIIVTDQIKFIQDAEAKRIYFEFDFKPDAEIRTLLKSNGFKWTPSKGHWGRVTTANAMYSAERVLKGLNQHFA